MSGRKKLLRKEFLRKRRMLSSEQRREESNRILFQLKESTLFRQATEILAYFPLPEEADISPVRSLCYETGKRIAYPKTEGAELSFYEVLPEDSFIEGVFHVMEPVTRGRAPVEWESALCLTPGAAFDGYGNRYGYGKGYYDRYFALHPGLLRIGVAFRTQISEGLLPTEEKDMALHYLLTADGIAKSAGLKQEIR